MEFGGFTIIIVILGFVLVKWSVTTVTQGNEYTVERFGRYTPNTQARAALYRSHN